MMADVRGDTAPAAAPDDSIYRGEPSHEPEAYGAHDEGVPVTVGEVEELDDGGYIIDDGTGARMYDAGEGPLADVTAAAVDETAIDVDEARDAVDFFAANPDAYAELDDDDQEAIVNIARGLQQYEANDRADEQAAAEHDYVSHVEDELASRGHDPAIFRQHLEATGDIDAAGMAALRVPAPTDIDSAFDGWYGESRNNADLQTVAAEDAAYEADLAEAKVISPDIEGQEEVFATYVVAAEATSTRRSSTGATPNGKKHEPRHRWPPPQRRVAMPRTCAQAGCSARVDAGRYCSTCAGRGHRERDRARVQNAASPEQHELSSRLEHELHMGRERHCPPGATRVERYTRRRPGEPDATVERLRCHVCGARAETVSPIPAAA